MENSAFHALNRKAARLFFGIRLGGFLPLRLCGIQQSAGTGKVSEARFGGPRKHDRFPLAIFKGGRGTIALPAENPAGTVRLSDRQVLQTRGRPDA
jgi:hypothetical protein